MNFKKIISDLKKLYNISRSLSFKRKKIRIGLSLILSNLNAFLEIFIVILISFVLTNELPDNEFLEYVDVALFTRALPLIVLLRLGINYLTHWNREKMFIDLHASLKKDAAKKLFRKENLSFAYILYKVSSESNSIVATYKSLMTAVNMGTQLLTFSVTLLILNPNLTLTVALIALILGKPVSIVLGIFKKNSILNAKIMFFVDSVYERILSNYYLIKLLNKEEEELDRFSKAIDESSDIQWVNSKSSFVVYNLINSSTTLLITILLVQPFFNIKIW